MTDGDNNNNHMDGANREDKEEEEEDNDDDDSNNRMDKEEEEEGAWVTWPERPKGTKDKVKIPEGQKAGPKGRQQEARAQRAPRLLVCYIFEKVMVRGPQKR